ncbi:MAG TPA: hypothetical protein VN688_22215 [Gemmataceae bacterium]|nr:hypothetical protein [Gemmataceae bacterium]
MQLLECDDAHVVLELTHNELIVLNNALKEVCHGIDLPDFSTRLGAQRGEIEALLRQISDVFQAMTKGKDEG